MSDYISRQDAIDTIHKTIYEIFGYQDGKVFTDTDELLLMVNKLLCKKIREIPAAEVVPMDFHERCLQIEIEKRMNMERKKAEWRETEMNRVMCTECNYICDIAAKFLYSYCPNCGSDMRR